MDLLGLKRSLWALRGFRNEENQSNHNSENNTFGGGGGSYAGYTTGSLTNQDPATVSYANPDLSQVTNMPVSGLSTSDQVAVGNIRNALDSGALTRDQLNKVLSGKPSDEQKSFLDVLGFLFSGKLGQIGVGLLSKAMTEKDPLQAMRGLADKLSKDNGGAGYSPSTGNAGSGRSNDASVSSITDLVTNSVNPAQTTPATATTPSATDSTSDSAWNDWTKTDKPALQNMASTVGQRGSTAYDLSTQAAQQGLSTAIAANQDYNNVFRPSYQKLSDQVNKYGSDAYQAQQRGIAMADVQQQGDNAIQQAQRNQMRMGVDPSSGRMAAIQNQGAMTLAGQKAMAAQSATTNAQNQYTSGLTGMSNLGLNVQASGNTASNNARDWTTSGLAAGAQGFGAGLDLSKMSGTMGTAANNAANNTMNAQSQRINANNGVQQTSNAQSAADLKNDPWAVLGGAAVTGLGNALFGSSDGKVKSVFDFDFG